MRTAASVDGSGRCRGPAGGLSGGSGPEQQHDGADDRRESEMNPEQSEVIFHGCSVRVYEWDENGRGRWFSRLNQSSAGCVILHFPAGIGNSPGSCAALRTIVGL